MYNLKKIYGVISFGFDSVKIAIFDAFENTKHCLFYTSEKLPINPYTDNIEKTKNILTTKLLDIDKFIGIQIKRYLICIEDLSMNINIKTSDELNCKNENEILKYLNQDIESKIKDNFVSLKKDILAYQTNGSICNEFPKNAKKIKVTYLDYWTKTGIDLIRNILSIIDKSNIKILGIYNTPIAYQLSSIDLYKNKNHVLIDLHNEVINIYQFDSSNRIIQINNIEFGTNWLINQLVNKLNVNSEIIISWINNFNIFKNINENIPLMNIHDQHYLELQQIAIKDFKIVCYQLIKEFFNKIIDQIDMNEISIWNINCENDWHNIFSFIIKNASKPLCIKESPVTFIKESLTCIENEKINNLIWTLNAAIYQQTKFDLFVYSIDSYIAEEITNRQLNKSLLLKLGIFSTSLSAKLGSMGEGIWEKS